MTQDNQPPVPGPAYEPRHPGYGPQGYAPQQPYGHYQGSYHYQGYADQAVGPQRSLRDYIMLVRERVWYLILAVFVCTVAAVIWNQSGEPEYRATAQFKILRNRVTATASMGTTLDDKDRIIDDRDFSTQIKAMQTNDLIQRVAKRLTTEERNDALAPYQKGNIFTGPLTPDEVIGKCFSITPVRQTFIALVQYRHPDKKLAVKMANYFVDEIQRQNDQETAATSDPVIESLKLQNDQILEDIKTLNQKKNELIEREKILTRTKDVATANAELANLASVRESDKRAYEEMKANRDQLLADKAAGKSTLSNNFIAKDERVMAMSGEVSKLEIQISALLKKYTEKHINVITARQSLAQSRIELEKAAVDAEAKLDSAYKNSATNLENSTRRYETKQAEFTGQAKAFTEYESLEKEIKNKEELYNRMQMSYEIEKSKRGGTSANPIRRIEAANPEEKPINKYALLLVIAGGLGLGTVLGLGVIFLLSALDDRVKSSSDIEQLIGLPLIGVIPKIKRLDNFKRARTVSTGADRATTESFHAIYSALKIHDQARKAKAILTTSTTPSEGKSFFTTNLAMTFAMHGEKVIVVDADLRLPNVGKSLQVAGEAGITQYQAGIITLDEAIRRDVVPNLDILPVGASCKNPTQVLNSKKFSAMIEELKGRYDRVFIDSPPVGAVSDALNLMPQVDGAIYVVKFNTVKRNSMKGNLRRLQESKVPVFGAVLNQIGLHVANYYTSTYDKAYNKYYHDSDPHAVEVKVS